MKLPERKKSAEEIAKLRDELGVFAQPPAPQATGTAPAPPASPSPVSPTPAPPATEPAATTTPSAISHPLPGPTVPDLSPLPTPLPVKPVSSLRKSERIPSLPATAPTTSVSTPTPGPAPIVHSLRKSEQIATPLAKPAALAPEQSHLPAHRHSEQALSKIRHQSTLAARFAPSPPRFVAELPLVIFGYLTALIAPACVYFLTSLVGPAVCGILALATAAFIFLKRPYSRHHAAFILILVFLTAIFGALYHFPQLRHVP
ncbi:MAG: hypothetical protein QM627_04425 [Luteolibacter sp.]